MLLRLALAALGAWFVYRKTKSAIGAIIAAIAIWCAMTALTAEQFETEWAHPALGGTEIYPSGRSCTRQDGPYGAHPFMYPPYMAADQGCGGDLTLTNLYRRLHNMDAIERTEIFQFNDALAGGGHGIPRERLVGEAYDRGMMRLNQQIREDIAAKRRPFDEAYDVPTKPLMGNFWECHVGDCQWDADDEGHILGIPSQVGTEHGYF